MQQVCRRVLVSGKVQGVFYRQNTLEMATKLHLTGWVKNLSNGDVELVACGKENNVDALCEWLWQGPPAARVDNVKVTDEPEQSLTQFEIR